MKRVKKRVFFVLFFLLATGTFGLKAEVTVISGLKEAKEKLISTATFIGKLSDVQSPENAKVRKKENSEQWVPNIKKLSQKNRKFLAVMQLFKGMSDKLYFFDTQDDADELVEAVNNGGGMDITWYYIDVNKK